MIMKIYIRRLMLLASDTLLIGLSYYAAYRLALEMHAHEFDSYRITFWRALPWLLGVRILCGTLVRQYTWAFRQASLAEAAGLVKAAGAGTILFIILTRYGNILGNHSRSRPGRPTWWSSSCR